VRTVAICGACAKISSAGASFEFGSTHQESSMSKPIIVSIPHALGKEEAVRRLKSGFASVPGTFGKVLAVQEEVWTGDHLQFRVSALGQVASGTIDVAHDHVRLELALPWLLAQLVEKIRPQIQDQVTLMLEKK
jgi:hypothetical protein